MKVKVIQREKEGSKPKPTRYYSGKQEKQVASTIGGTQTSNSGALPFQKGDILTDKFLIEAKTKMKPSDSISIKKEWLEKIVQESLFMGKEHTALSFNFGPNEKNYFIIDENLFLLLIDFLNQ